MHPLAGKRIAITGGSGFLGVSLAYHLAELGSNVVIVSRNKPKPVGPWEFAAWDGRSLGAWSEVLDGSDGVVNLAGRNVNCIKSADHRDEILRSRVESTRILGKAMQRLQQPPPIWLQMSTAHIYGDPPSAVCTEESEFGYGLAPDVARAWEAAYHDSVLPTQRQVVLRTSFVVGRDRGAGNGALSALVPLARVGLGGRIASGTQGMSWIHEHDMNRLFERGLVEDSMSGVYIASSPHPVSQVEFMRTLRSVLGMPIGLPATEWMVRIGAALVMRTDPELILYGRYVYSQRLRDDGFKFHYPKLREALANLLK